MSCGTEKTFEDKGKQELLSHWMVSLKQIEPSHLSVQKNKAKESDRIKKHRFHFQENVGVWWQTFVFWYEMYLFNDL